MRCLLVALADIAIRLLDVLGRIGMVLNAPNLSMVTQRRNAAAAAEKLGISFVAADITTISDIETAFSKLSRDGAQAVLIPTDSTFSIESRRVADAALRARLRRSGRIENKCCRVA